MDSTHFHQRIAVERLKLSIYRLEQFKVQLRYIATAGLIQLVDPFCPTPVCVAIDGSRVSTRSLIFTSWLQLGAYLILASASLPFFFFFYPPLADARCSGITSAGCPGHRHASERQGSGEGCDSQI